MELNQFADRRPKLKSLRILASQQGADALLLIQGMSEVETKTNEWAATYVALLPVFFVKRNKVEGTFLTQTVLWNVKGPYVHLGGQSEGEFSQKRPLASR